MAPAADLAARVLWMLSRHRTQRSTLTEITRMLEVSKTSCMRVLKTLQYHGLIDYEEVDRRYHLGWCSVVLGERARTGMDLLERSKPLMQEIVDRTLLTVALVQRTGADRMAYTAKQDGADAANVHISVGNRFPIFAVSYGKWVVAFTPPSQRADLVPDGLPRMTDSTRTDRRAYLHEVEALGPGSVLESRNEYVKGVYAVSIPILGPNGELEAVMTALGFSQRVDTDKARQVIEVMGAIARRINGHVIADMDDVSSFHRK
jgi:DNA-binding IclR family transcriptional regulator